MIPSIRKALTSKSIIKTFRICPLSLLLFETFIMAAPIIEKAVNMNYFYLYYFHMFTSIFGVLVGCLGGLWGFCFYPDSDKASWCFIVSGCTAANALYHLMEDVTIHYAGEADHKPWFMLSKIYLSKSEPQRLALIMSQGACGGLGLLSGVSGVFYHTIVIIEHPFIHNEINTGKFLLNLLCCVSTILWGGALYAFSICRRRCMLQMQN